MKGSAAKIQMAGLDELFGLTSSDTTGEHVQEITSSELHTFRNHPFHVVDDEKMQEMAESVAQHGVLVPGIVRPRPEGGYELIAGHRRKSACELAGLETMRVIVRDMDDDEGPPFQRFTLQTVQNIFQLPRRVAFGLGGLLDFVLARLGALYLVHWVTVYKVGHVRHLEQRLEYCIALNASPLGLASCLHGQQLGADFSGGNVWQFHLSKN